MIDYKLAHALFEYNPDTGSLVWRVHTSATPKGKEAGTLSDKKKEYYTRYRNVSVLGDRYKAHRIIWLMQTGSWPEKYIDHIDGNGLNNKWSNLREASPSENMANQKVRSDSTSGIKGVSYDKKRNMWYVYIDINKKRKHLGRFETREEAAAARIAAEKVYHGAFAKGA
jgi:hypothetical protein